MKLEDLRSELKLQLKSGNRSAVSVLRLIIGTLDMESKIGKIDVVAKIKSEIKKSNEALTFKSNETLTSQIKYLESLLPKQLTAGQIIDILETRKPENIGQAMKIFKTEYNGMFDGKLTSNLVADFLK